jgi:hypothetical protein
MPPNYFPDRPDMKKILLFAVFCLMMASNLSAQIPALERLEPMFWWVGMHNPDLQLIVHGNDIASRKVELNYPGVKLTAVHKVENPNYLFLDIPDKIY